MSAEPVLCSSFACDKPATETLYLRNQVGHVHDCPTHAHDLREFCDVITSSPIIGGSCVAEICTDEPIYSAAPTPLDAD